MAISVHRGRPSRSELILLTVGEACHPALAHRLRGYSKGEIPYHLSLGGVCRSVSISIYFTSSHSCCGPSFCRFIVFDVWARVIARCLRDRVDRSTPSFWIVSLYENYSPTFSDFVSASAASIGLIAVELCSVEVFGVWCSAYITRIRTSRESVHHAHRHGTVTCYTGLGYTSLSSVYTKAR